MLHCLKLRSLPEDLSGVASLSGMIPHHRNVVSSAAANNSVVKVPERVLLDCLSIAREREGWKYKCSAQLFENLVFLSGLTPYPFIKQSSQKAKN